MADRATRRLQPTPLTASASQAVPHPPTERDLWSAPRTSVTCRQPLLGIDKGVATADGRDSEHEKFPGFAAAPREDRKYLAHRLRCLRADFCLPWPDDDRVPASPIVAVSWPGYHALHPGERPNPGADDEHRGL
jgi:hypothetical protein